MKILQCAVPPSLVFTSAINMNSAWQNTEQTRR